MTILAQGTPVYVRYAVEKGVTIHNGVIDGVRESHIKDKHIVEYLVTHNNHSQWLASDLVFENLDSLLHSSNLEIYPNTLTDIPMIRELHPDTGALVIQFTKAFVAKLIAAEKKYGYGNEWLKTDWYNDCLHELNNHIEKGDPRDVAAYCMFMWHHNWSTSKGCCAGGPQWGHAWDCKKLIG